MFPVSFSFGETAVSVSTAEVSNTDFDIVMVKSSSEGAAAEREAVNAAHVQI